MKKNLFILMLMLITGITVSAQIPERAGWWKFDDNLDVLKATVGDDLTASGSVLSVDGPVTGNKAVQVDVGTYLMMTHNIAGNGGGAMVNEYSLMIDFSVPEANIWHSFFQTDLTNESDGDLFTSNASNAIGTSATGYSSKGVAVDTWYRMVIVVRNGEMFRIYVNGALWLDGTNQPIDGRFALDAQLLVFADNDGEDGIVNCSELAIWDIALSDDEIIQLGDATGARVRDRNKMGSWKFDDPADLTKASVGKPLQLTGTQESVAGPADSNNAIRIGLGSYLTMLPGIALNGNDTLVNEYSLQFDFLMPEAGVWHAFFQTNPKNNDDADLFINKNTNAIGTATTNYSVKTITDSTWYRMVVTVKNGEFFRIYLNGELWLDAPGQSIDGRWGLGDTLLLFADDDGDDGEILCSEINLWEVALTEDEVIGLGEDPTNKIPDRVGWWKFDDAADMLKAEIGSPLTLTGSQTSIAGPAGGNLATSIIAGDYLTMSHGIGPNGAGAMVNEYTLQFDFQVPELGIWHCFMQTDGTNSSDGDLFTNTANAVGTSSTTYSGNQIESGKWYRMMVTVKNGTFFRIYMDGELWLDAAGQATDGRFALEDNLLVFADNDGEDGTIYCAELGIWDRALSADQVAKVGKVSTITGINPVSRRNANNLQQNYPNPFSVSTTFEYHVLSAGNVTFRILDLSGKEISTVIEGMRTPGNYTLNLSGEKLQPGMYYVQMISGNTSSMRKMMVVR
ncbi:MAG: LamG-like jellyroll fold domain-containing protein [Bacteroidales bacterium]